MLSHDSYNLRLLGLDFLKVFFLNWFRHMTEKIFDVILKTTRIKSLDGKTVEQVGEILLNFFKNINWLVVVLRLRIFKYRLSDSRSKHRRSGPSHLRSWLQREMMWCEGDCLWHY